MLLIIYNEDFYQMSQKNSYEKFSKKTAKPSPIIKDASLAFFIGGGICVLGQAFKDLYLFFGLGDEISSTLMTGTLIFLSCLFTGLGIYDRIAKYGGAGTLVPVTGFANAMCAPSIDNKAEGYVLGVGAKMFVISGPVIVYGTLSSIILGIVILILKLFEIDITGWIL